MWCGRCTRRTCLVSRFQWVQKRVSALSISRLGTWKNHNHNRCEKKKNMMKNRRVAFADLEGNSFIWFSSKKQVLPSTVRGLDPLFIGRHETVPGSNSFSNFWIIDLLNTENGWFFFCILYFLCLTITGKFIDISVDNENWNEKNGISQTHLEK